MAKQKLNIKDYSDLLIQMEDNHRIIAAAEEALRARFKIYQQSLDRLSVSSPDVEADTAQQILSDLNQTINSPPLCHINLFDTILR